MRKFPKTGRPGAQRLARRSEMLALPTGNFAVLRRSAPWSCRNEKVGRRSFGQLLAVPPSFASRSVFLLGIVPESPSRKICPKGTLNDPWLESAWSWETRWR